MGKTFSQSPGVTDLEIIKSSKVAFDADKVAPAAFEIVNDATFSDKTNMSVGSAAYMLMGAAITVDVTSIPGTPLSSTESEKYMEAVAMARGIGYTNLLTEMDMPQPKPIRMWVTCGATTASRTSSRWTHAPVRDRRTLRAASHSRKECARAMTKTRQSIPTGAYPDRQKYG